MSNAQADSLRINVLADRGNKQIYLMLKPAAIRSKEISKLTEGSLLSALDPLHLRIVRGDQILARARLGRLGIHEAIHITSIHPEQLLSPLRKKEHLLEVRLRIVSEGIFEKGAVIEYSEPLTQGLLVLIDKEPVAIARIVEYDNDPMLQITRMLHE